MKRDASRDEPRVCTTAVCLAAPDPDATKPGRIEREADPDEWQERGYILAV